MAAKKRGVDVEIILDRSNTLKTCPRAPELAKAGCRIFVDRRHRIAHDKVMILDEATVVTGSFNWTRSAEESNGENLLVLRSPELAKAYLANFEKHREHTGKHE